MKLGEHLVKAGVIDDAQLRAGLDRAASTRERLGAALIALGHASGDQIAVALGQQHGVPPAKDRHIAAAPARLAERVPAELARRLRAVIVGEGRDRELVIAMANPLDVDAIGVLETTTRRVVVTAAASTARLDPAIARLYPIAVAGDIASAAAAAADALGPPRLGPPPVERFDPRATTVDLDPRALALELDPELPMTAITPPLGADIAASDNEGPGELEIQPAIEVRASVEPVEPVEPVEASPMIEVRTEPQVRPEPEPEPEQPPATPPPATFELTINPPPAAPPPATARTSTRTIPTTRRLPQLAGGTSLASASSSTGGGMLPVILRYGIGFAVMTVTATLTYRHCTRDTSWAIGKDYNSTYMRAHLPVPGGGWRGHDTLRMDRQNGDSWARLEGFYRGADVDDPDEGLLVLRVHSPGMFPEEVDMDAFRRQIDQTSRQILSSAGNLQATTIDCVLEPRVRSEPAGKCRGTGTFRDQVINIYMFYWEDTVDDTMAVIYVAKGRLEDRLAELETFIAGIQVL